MRTVPRLALLGIALAVLVAAPANAARVTFSQRCYFARATVTALGTGFTPSTAYSAYLTLPAVLDIGGPEKRTPDDTGVTDATGRTNPFRFPARVLREGEGRLPVEIKDAAGVSATGWYSATVLSANAAPTSGDPRRVRPRFEFFGFGRGRTIWMHYVDPRGRHVKARRMGRAGGFCGRLLTGRRKLFVVAPRPGTWRFQFDTSRRYSSRTRPRVVRTYTIRVV